MESKSRQLCFSRNELAANANKQHAAWNPGPLLKFMTETNCLPPFPVKDASAANAPNSQFAVANEGFEAPSYVRTIGTALAPTPASFSSAVFSSRGFPLSNEFKQSLFVPPFNDTGSRGDMSNISKPCHAGPEKLDVQQFEVPPRRFVMFDDNGSKKRMFFHPMAVNEFSPNLYSSGNCSQRVISRKETLVGSMGASFSQYASLLLGIPGSFHVDSQYSASNNRDVQLKIGGEGTRKEDIHGAPEISFYLHENTEELEALLSSDDDEESSTGHSPSDLTQMRNNSLTVAGSTSGAYGTWSRKKHKRRRENDTSSTRSKKQMERFCSNMDHSKEDFTISEWTHMKDRCKDLCYGNETLIPNDVTQLGKLSSFVEEDANPDEVNCNKDLGYGKEDSTTFDLILSDEAGSSGSANNQSNLPFTQQPLLGQSRKEKVKSILRRLRRIVPGGESMDTAFVLDEAIQYVKTLQFAVQKLQARKCV